MLRFLKFLKQKIDYLISKSESKIKVLKYSALTNDYEDPDFDIDGDDDYEDDDEVDDDELALDEIADLFEDYIGLVITKFESYKIGVPDLSQLLPGKMITKVELENDKIIISLASISSDRNNKLIITLTEGGFFSAVEKADSLHRSAKYRIIFVGGDAIEYIDTEAEVLVDFC